MLKFSFFELVGETNEFISLFRSKGFAYSQLRKAGGLTTENQ